MIPKLAIERAIEGGWNALPQLAELYTTDDGASQTVALDPTFWQALGITLHWKADTWFGHAQDFIDLILTGGNTGKFWDELLS